MNSRLIRSTRYLAIIGVVSAWLGAVAAFGWTLFKTIALVVELVRDHPDSTAVVVAFIQLMDYLLVATGLLIFAIGLYVLFLGDLDVPPWLRLKSLHELKVRLSSVIILVMAVAFLQHLVEWERAEDTLLLGGAIALVSGALILYANFGGRE